MTDLTHPVMEHVHKSFVGHIYARLLALFSSEFLSVLDIVVLLFLFDNYYLIIDLLNLKDSSCDLYVKYVISFCFFVYI